MPLACLSSAHTFRVIHHRGHYPASDQGWNGKAPSPFSSYHQLFDLPGVGRASFRGMTSARLRAAPTSSSTQQLITLGLGRGTQDRLFVHSQGRASSSLFPLMRKSFSVSSPLVCARGGGWCGGSPSLLPHTASHLLGVQACWGSTTPHCQVLKPKQTLHRVSSKQSRSEIRSAGQ